MQLRQLLLFVSVNSGFARSPVQDEDEDAAQGKDGQILPLRFLSGCIKTSNGTLRPLRPCTCVGTRRFSSPAQLRPTIRLLGAAGGSAPLSSELMRDRRTV